MNSLFFISFRKRKRIPEVRNQNCNPNVRNQTGNPIQTGNPRNSNKPRNQTCNPYLHLRDLFKFGMTKNNRRLFGNKASLAGGYCRRRMLRVEFKDLNWQVRIPKKMSKVVVVPFKKI